MTRTFVVMCPGSNKWVDEDVRFVAASAAAIKQREMRLRCDFCGQRVAVASDGRTAVHNTEVESTR